MKNAVILSEEEKFDGAIFKVIERKLIDPNGEKITRQLVPKKDSVVIAILNENEEVYIQKEYRSGVNQIESGIPAGMINPGEDPATAARREVLEETGLEANTLEFAFKGNLSEGFTTEASYCYVAHVDTRTAEIHEQNLDHDEFIDGGHFVSQEEAMEKMSSMSAIALLNYIK